MSYPQDLSRELERVGIRGRLRQRIVSEFEDHLSLDPSAQLGGPAEIARQFADELGTRRTLRAAGFVFAALVVAGLMAAVAFLSSGPAGLYVPALHARDEALGALAGVVTVLGAQVALAAGTLAVVRAFWHRHETALSHAEAIVIGRRAGVAAVSGMITMLSMALFTLQFNQGVHGWWTTVVLAGAGIGVAALLAATPALVSAARLRPLGAGDAGDISADLGPLMPRALRGHPWRFAALFSLLIAAALTVAGVAGADGYDGALRGLLDAFACLAGFGLLGGYLSLR